MTRRINSICYKVFTSFSLGLGIFLNLQKTPSRKALLSYYTLQSNIICLIAFGIIIIFELIKKQYNTEMYYLLKGALIVAISITAIIYHILVILDYFIFDEKGHFKFYYPFIWLIQPLNYLVYVYTYSRLGGTFYNIGGSKKFAYFFLDYDKLGYMGVGKWLIAIGLLILIIAEVLVLIDRKLF